MTNQPTWKLVYATNYSALYIDETGVYAPELMVAEEINDAPDSERFQVFRFSLDRLECVTNCDKTYMVSEHIARGFRAGTLPHPIGQYSEWFDDDLALVAASVGSSREDLISGLCCEDPGTRAEVYEAIGGYHGYLNLDGYPSRWSESEMAAWPERGPKVAVTESEDNNESTSEEV